MTNVLRADFVGRQRTRQRLPRYPKTTGLGRLVNMEYYNLRQALVSKVRLEYF